MTSKIIVNNIEADSGISSITFNDSIFIGDINSTGTSTLGNTVVGGGTTELIVNGDARITGILTVGTASVTLNGNDGVVSGINTINGVTMPAAGGLTNRNMIINGGCKVSQRGTSFTGLTAGQYTVDRMLFGMNSGNSGTWTFEQSTDAPDGFKYSVKCTNTVAFPASPIAGAYMYFPHMIEGQDLQHLKFGTSEAETTTISFWVKSNVTGNYSFGILQNDNSLKQVAFTYTINAASTWEYKTITIPGDTAGVIDSNNEKGLQFEWWLNSGTTYTGGSAQSTWTTFDNTRRNFNNPGVGNNTSDFWQITGIQFEVGSRATPFEHRTYGDELARCQRYYEIIAHWYGGSNAYGTIWSKPLNSFTNCWTDVRFKVTKRAPNYNFGLLGSTAWVGTTPDVHNDGVDAIVFQASGHYYLSNGSSSARDMAYVESELL